METPQTEAVNRWQLPHFSLRVGCFGSLVNGGYELYLEIRSDEKPILRQAGFDGMICEAPSLKLTPKNGVFQ